ncbi:hypothetical protein F3087_07370 [Nocardia colli]|uniref:DUF4303 domain-containing protein n=1 Tax=Nocardia colli TaxID=2545717 RepID=A0A5N0EHQ0_9NOCA|nr:hypothetical protein [Nocardia colli]KAA8888822.1 hypothetical protein F3087_07370 [Nocardia colli]
MTSQEDEFAAAMARAIAEDLRAYPRAGALVRVVVRWFEEARPSYFTVHALGADERAEIPPEDAWCPLEWENLDDETDRGIRVEEHPRVQQAGEALEAIYRADPPERDHDDYRPSPAIFEVIRRLPDELRAAGIPLDPEFSTSAAHFESLGALAVLQDLAPPHLLAALKARGELPTD